MNKYESMTWEELRELPSEEFYKIPKTYLDQAVTEYYERVPPEESEIFVDDSILLFEEPYENSEDLFYDILPLDDEKLIPKYDFVKNWSEDQLRDFITTPSGLPHRLMSIVREVIPNINRLRLIQYIEHPEFESLDQDERAVTYRLKYEGKHKEAREYHIQYALDFLDKYPQFKPMVKIVE